MRLKSTIILLFCSLQLFGQLSVETPNSSIQFPNANTSSFKVHYDLSDTIYIEVIDYEGLEGEQFLITPEATSVRVQYEFGFSQYTIDDNPWDFQNCLIGSN